MAGIEGRAVLVTGGGAAVGRARASDLAAPGASVGVIDVDDEHGDECVARIADAGGKAFYRHADVRVESEVAAAVAEVVPRFGRLDGAGTEAPMALIDADVATS